jgi:hypothetical protein
MDASPFFGMLPCGAGFFAGPPSRTIRHASSDGHTPCVAARSADGRFSLKLGK